MNPRLRRVFLLPVALGLFSLCAWADLIPVGALIYSVTVPGSTAEFDIANQTGPNGSIFPDTTFPIASSEHLTITSLTVDFTDGSTTIFGPAYFTLAGDGLSFNGASLDIGSTQPIDATLVGTFNDQLITLNDGSSSMLSPPFAFLNETGNGSPMISDTPQLADGDLAVIYASNVPEPATWWLLGSVLLGLLVLRHGRLPGSWRAPRPVDDHGSPRLALFFLCLLLIPTGSWASVPVHLNVYTTPDNGVAGVNNANVVGSGFPAGTITPANVQVLLSSIGCFMTSTDPTQYATTTGISVKQIIGTSDRIGFLVPASLATNTYNVWIADSANGDANFTSGNCSLIKVTHTPGWPQWGQNPRHSGSIGVTGQNLNQKLANLIYDPFVAQIQAENGGELLAHFQAPLTDDQDVFMEFISGNYTSCNPVGSYTPFPCGNDNWFNQIWNERALRWEQGQLVETWTFASDWKPEPDAGGELGGWQPVFHAALTSGGVWVPGAGGTVFELNRNTGLPIARFNPFGSTIDPDTFVSSPITADSQGNIYYNVLKLNITSNPFTNDPWSYGPNFDGNGATDIPDAWLVKISSGGVINTVSYKNLTFTPAAPTTCNATFSGSILPWPPSPTATPRTVPCLSQRPGVNITPAIAPDGTIYSVTVAHNPFASRYAYVVAFYPDLSLKWTASMRARLNDGCGVLIPIASSTSPQANSCRIGANFGVDPSTNDRPAGRVIDQSTASPVVTPDGGVMYGAYNRYDFARGHLFRFDANGNFMAAYDFGWDSTPAIYPHNGTYSIVIKDNHYATGNYCDPGGDPVSQIVCVTAPQGPFLITQLDPNMNVEWQFQNTSTDGTHNNGFEWCVNAPAVDLAGNVYANSEDGNLYAIQQGGTLRQKIFLNQALGAAYTPLSLGPDGKLYAENDGVLFAIGQ